MKFKKGEFIFQNACVIEKVVVSLFQQNNNSHFHSRQKGAQIFSVMKKVNLHPNTPSNIALYTTPEFAFWVVDGSPYFCNPTDAQWLRQWGEEDVTPSKELNQCLKKARSQKENVFRIIREIGKKLNIPDFKNYWELAQQDFWELAQRDWWGLAVFQDGLQVGQNGGIYTRNKQEWDQVMDQGPGNYLETKQYRFEDDDRRSWMLEIF